MTCHDARDLFSALADDALTAPERAELDAHLAGCADCRHELARFRATVSLLRAVEPARAPAGFVDRVVAAARPTPWHRRLARALFLPWPVKLPLEAAAIVLVGVVVTLVFRATPELEKAARIESPRAFMDAPARGLDAAPSAAPVGPTPTPALRAPAATPTASAQVAAPPASVAAQAAKSERPAPAAAPAPPAERREEKPAKPDAEYRTGTLGDAKERDLARRRDVKAAPAEQGPAESKAAAPAPGRVQSIAKEKASGDVARQSLALEPVPAHVAGRLVVADRTAAEPALAALVARVGGAEVRRLEAPDGTTFELLIPRVAWADFLRGLVRLGTWRPEREPAELPVEIRVALRLVAG